jgi:hypothetical protein
VDHSQENGIVQQGGLIEKCEYQVDVKYQKIIELF